jgi:DNA-binding protein HU-beta
MKQFQPSRSLSLISLIEAVAEESGVSREQTGRVVRTTLDIIARTVSNLHNVRLSNFGTFAPVVRAARLRHNPATGEQFHSEAYMAPKFSPRGKFYDTMVKGEPVNDVRKDPKP